MRLKTYIVATMAQAIPMIKEDLGADALILNTKKIKTGGFLGFFQKEKLEVTAAVDPVATTKPPETETPMNVENPTDLIEELKTIKQFMMKQIKEEDLPKHLQLVKRKLVDQELAVTIQDHILGKLLTRLESSNEQTIETTWQMGHEELVKLISGHQVQSVVQSPKTICFIGPTGVGKTTTIAKIAAGYMLNSNKRIGLITADTYRIAAVEQVKTYGTILNIPVKVVESSTDLTAAINDFQDCDLILIDTAGRNYQQAQYIENLKHLLPDDHRVYIHLVLSLTSKYEDMKKIIDNFSSVTIDELLLTKKDETGSSGALVNLIYDYAIPIRYIANGQNVPDDIVSFTPELAADFIMGEQPHA